MLSYRTDCFILTHTHCFILSARTVLYLYFSARRHAGDIELVTVKDITVRAGITQRAVITLPHRFHCFIIIY